MKLPDDYIDMLQNHCDKLEELDFHLFDLWSKADNPDLKAAELWLQTQQQLRLTAIELMRNQRAEPSEKPRSNAEKRQAISNQPTQTSTQLIAAAKAKAAAARKP
jgi:hypothetical protein